MCGSGRRYATDRSRSGPAISAGGRAVTTVSGPSPRGRRFPALDPDALHEIDVRWVRSGALLVALRTPGGRHGVAEPQDDGHGQQDRQEDHIDGDLGDVLELRGQPRDQAVDEV